MSYRVIVKMITKNKASSDSVLERGKSNSMQKPQSWYVYTYLLPDDTVFYVGKGTGNRINDHENEASRDCPCKKCTTIREVWASGNIVKKRIVFETLNESEALAKESELIQEYAGEHLSNVRTNPVPADKPDNALEHRYSPEDDLLLFRFFPQAAELIQHLPMGMTVTFNYAFNKKTGLVSDAPVKNRPQS